MSSNSSLKFSNGYEKLRPSRGRTATLVVTGDFCPMGKVLADIRAGLSNEIAAAPKTFIDSADVRALQLETPLTNANSPIDKSGPNLKCPPYAVDLVKALGVNVALLANNHIGDHGGAVVLETIRRVQDAGIKTVGAGANPEAATRPLIVKARGISLALLNVAEHEFGTVTASKPGCAPLSPLANIKAIREATGKADLVMVFAHGGHEFLPLPSPRMKETYRAFIEAGAHAVVNCHTHCPQGIEIWNGSPIVYSPGNFFFPCDDLNSEILGPLWWIGYMPKFHFDKQGVFGVEIRPLRFDNKRIYNFNAADTKAFYGYMASLNRLTCDDSVVLRYFEAWSAHYGARYLGWIRDRLVKSLHRLGTRKAVRNMLPVRNIFTCEAHHDMVSQFLRLLEEGRVAKALKPWPAIQKLQRPAWAERHWHALQNSK